MRRAREIPGCRSLALPLLLSAVILAPGTGAVAAAPNVSFLAHQAVYNLSLKNAGQRHRQQRKRAHPLQFRWQCLRGLHH